MSEEIKIHLKDIVSKGDINIDSLGIEDVTKYLKLLASLLDQII
jgi:hypothetical protein